MPMIHPTGRSSGPISTKTRQRWRTDRRVLHCNNHPDRPYPPLSQVPPVSGNIRHDSLDGLRLDLIADRWLRVQLQTQSVAQEAVENCHEKLEELSTSPRFLPLFRFSSVSRAGTRGCA